MLSRLLLHLYSLELSFFYLYIGSILIGYSRGFSDVLSSYIQRIGTIMLNHLRGKSPRAMKKRLAKECSWNTSRTPLIDLRRQWDDGLQITNRNTFWDFALIHSPTLVWRGSWPPMLLLNLTIFQKRGQKNNYFSNSRTNKSLQESLNTTHTMAQLLPGPGRQLHCV